ncbi:uracil-DNA glycosylase family protein [Neptunomonas sp. XY-337]|uniref:uracil-DNA glycosylase family protein n=1 Tax=Neptunomonas sp. XY-337 TaxID=2561897 RepID=UPI0010A9E593|nr:uracil-DNA glycosylase family protein [Neptunomonas sp. XY-337]
MTTFENVKRCTLCAAQLPNPPKPILQFNPKAKILIAGQAPGQIAHDAGVPFQDASGERLRSWMGVTENTFYDATQVAILPMAFCYPGRGKSGDLAPSSECAKHWHAALLSELKACELILVVGKYAMRYHLGIVNTAVTSVVADWDYEGNRYFPLPHPSPRNNIWLRRNPWFEERCVPLLQNRVRSLLEY